MKFLRSVFLLLSIGFIFSCSPAQGDDSKLDDPSHSGVPRKLRVAVFERPPYTFKTEQGAWSGVGIELWGQIAEELHIPYEYVEVPFSEVYEKLHSGECDLTPAVSLVPKGIRLVDYTAPYFFSYAAVQTKSTSLFQQLASFYQNLIDGGILTILLIVGGIIVVFSIVIVIIERQTEEGHFADKADGKFFHALWFSALNLLCLEYDVALRLSPLGRFLTYFLAVLGICFVAIFTGAVASAITAANTSSKVFRIEELAHYRTGAVKGSTLDLALREKGLPVREYSSPEEGLAALDRGEISAFGGDATPLSYIAMNHFPGHFALSVVRSKPLFYVMAATPGLPQFAEINRKVLEISLSPDWRSRTEHWTGPLSF
jgi:ABC-type amino acid transport substrate-binding protein